MLGRKYSEPTPLSYSKMIDLFDTSCAILVFHYQVSIFMIVTIFILIYADCRIYSNKNLRL